MARCTAIVRHTNGTEYRCKLAESHTAPHYFAEPACPNCADLEATIAVMQKALRWALNQIHNVPEHMSPVWQKERIDAYATLSPTTGAQPAPCPNCAALERELERWRHGITIESDVICPNELEADGLQRERERLQDLVRQQEVDPDMPIPPFPLHQARRERDEAKALAANLRRQAAEHRSNNDALQARVGKLVSVMHEVSFSLEYDEDDDSNWNDIVRRFLAALDAEPKE